jgi:hypothetical protein
MNHAMDLRIATNISSVLDYNSDLRFLSVGGAGVFFKSGFIQFPRLRGSTWPLADAGSPSFVPPSPHSFNLSFHFHK